MTQCFKSKHLPPFITSYLRTSTLVTHCVYMQDHFTFLSCWLKVKWEAAQRWRLSSVLSSSRRHKHVEGRDLLFASPTSSPNPFNASCTYKVCCLSTLPCPQIIFFNKTPTPNRKTKQNRSFTKLKTCVWQKDTIH